MSCTMLKLIALFLMLLDHIWLFFPHSPILFHWLGRISAPIFLYCCTVGFVNTSSKKRYIFRIYLLNILMGIINYYFNIKLNFIRTLLLLLIIVYIIDALKNKFKHAKLLIFAFISWQITTLALIFYLYNTFNLHDKHCNLLATIFSNFANIDGGILFIIIGILMYVYRDSKLKLNVSFALITLIYCFATNTIYFKYTLRIVHRYNSYLYDILNMLFEIFAGFSSILLPTDYLYKNPQWMMIFSLFFINLYNKTKGRNLKYLFYIFYPTHIILLYCLHLTFL